MPSVVNHFNELDLTKKYTYSDYLLWQFSERVELIKGYIRQMSPAPSMVHQTISMNLSVALARNFKKKPCRFFAAPFDVRLPLKTESKETTVVQPDLCVVCDASKLDARGCKGAPDLIIEIISPNNSKHDIDTKFKLYQEAEVLEYWIVAPTEKIVLVYSLVNGTYIGLQPFGMNQQIESRLFPDLQMSVVDVFENV